MKRYPLVEEIPTPFSAAEVFGLFHQEPFAFFLDSGMDPAKLGRYSFIGCDPFLVLKSRGDELTLLSAGREERRKGNPFRVAGRAAGEIRPRPWRGAHAAGRRGGGIPQLRSPPFHRKRARQSRRRPSASGVLSGLLRRGHHVRSPGAAEHTSPPAASPNRTKTGD